MRDEGSHTATHTSKHLCIYTEYTNYWEHPHPPQHPKLVGAWTLQGVKSVPQGCWPILTPMLPTVVSSWMEVFVWWTILDTIMKLLGGKNPAALQFLTQSAPVTYYHTPFKGTYIFCLGHSTSEWHTYTIHFSIVSMLKNPYLTCLLPFIYSDLSGFNR